MSRDMLEGAKCSSNILTKTQQGKSSNWEGIIEEHAVQDVVLCVVHQCLPHQWVSPFLELLVWVAE